CHAGKNPSTAVTNGCSSFPNTGCHFHYSVICCTGLFSCSADLGKNPASKWTVKSSVSACKRSVVIYISTGVCNNFSPVFRSADVCPRDINYCPPCIFICNRRDWTAANLFKFQFSHWS